MPKVKPKVTIKVNEESRHKIKDDRWHVLNRTGMYMGSPVEGSYVESMVVDGKFEQIQISYIPAVVKMINEIIDNAVDISAYSKIKKVFVRMDKNSCQVTDFGSGIPIEYIKDLDGSNVLNPYAMFSKAKAGSNFNEDELDAATKGTNGVGAFCTNVLSTKFNVSTCDGHHTYKGVWSNNAQDYTEELLEPISTTGTSISFIPDFNRFNCTEISESVISIIRQRLINLSVVHSDIEFRFNTELIKYSREDFINMLGENGNVYYEDKYAIAVFPNDTDDFKSFSVLNGLNLKGGTHIEYLLKYIQKEIQEKLPAKYKSIKPGDIKNKLNIIMIGSDFPKIVWDGQTKEFIKNSDKEIRTYLGESWKDILSKIAKNKDITNPIIMLHAAKLSVEESKIASEADKNIKKKHIAKLKHAVKEKRWLVIVEGDSANKGLEAALGRDYFGFLPQKGKPVNTILASMKKIANNEELTNLAAALGISLSKKNSANDMLYTNVLIATDADVDGDHIKGLLFGFLNKFIPDIFDTGHLFILNTPVQVAYDKKENMKGAFFNADEFNEFIKIKTNQQYKIEYKKGLGSMNEKEYAQFFELRPFNTCLAQITATSKSIESLNDWLDEDSDFRKDRIQDRLALFDSNKI